MNDYKTHEHFGEIYGEEYLAKIIHLQKNLIERETGEDLFVVLPLEAGIGKSLQTDRIIGEYLSEHIQDVKEVWTSQGDYRQFLIVKQFVDDVQASVARINQCCGSQVALGITNNNWGRFKDNLESPAFHPVVIITHERYLRLAKDSFKGSSLWKVDIPWSLMRQYIFLRTLFLKLNTVKYRISYL